MVFSKLFLLLPDSASTTPQELDTTAPSSDQDTHSSSVLLAVERDVYYCYLVPLTIPVTILACYANWVSLKFFRHN